MKRDAFFRAFDRGTVRVRFRESQVELRTGRGLFSADRLDDGTRLLLDHVPDRAARVLDVGCGYGALGLPIAAAWPEARVLCVDRDLVAVRYAARNAPPNALARPSLGGDAIDERDFDLALCNVPARIGERGLAHLVESSARRLASGDVRIVVIRDLVPMVERLAKSRGWRCERLADGAGHAVFAIDRAVPEEIEDRSLYARDEIAIEGLAFARPHDSSEEAGFLEDGLPLLIELLPKRAAGRAIAWRSPHGVLATLLAKRGWSTTAADRDLLALRFAEINAARAGVEIRTRPLAWLPDLDERASLVVSCPSSTAGARVAQAELEAATAALEPGGHALVLAHANLSLEGARLLASRGRWRVLRRD